MAKTDIVAFIPARKGSKGIPGKNKKQFCGKPLVQWSIDQAKESNLFDKIVVSSDDEDILALAKQNDCIEHKRHPQLATDEIDLDVVLFDYFAREKNDCKHICMLQPTSPLRTTKDIVDSYKFLKKKRYESVVGVMWNPVMGWVEDATNHGSACLYLIDKRPNRQTRENWYLENGAIYWMTQESLLTYGHRIGNPKTVKLFEMPPQRSLEVDSTYEWFVAEKTHEWLQNGFASV